MSVSRGLWKRDEEEPFSSRLAFSSSAATQPESEEVKACRGELEGVEPVLGWSHASRMA